MKNVKFVYLYRDGANYKSWNDVIFTNPDHLTSEEIQEKLLSAFLPDKLFIAHQIFVPEQFLFLAGEFTQFDHCYHEFHAIEIVEEESTDSLNRSIKDFLKDVEQISRQGWKEFDILERVWEHELKFPEKVAAKVGRHYKTRQV
ncbi:MAG: hypothetical protein H6634_18845 [Anaerolineales bacterium]|nr:hypothetical protein [Anaerolineales bacterium]